MKMQSAMTIRLAEEGIKAIEDMATIEKKTNLQQPQILFSLEKMYFAVLQYKQDKILLEEAVETASITIS